jgi:hypothetical protein
MAKSLDANEGQAVNAVSEDSMDQDEFDGSIEAKIREKRRPTVANLVREVNERPGYHTVLWHKAIITYLLTGNREVLEWRKVQREALKTGQLRRDNAGKLWPATGPFPYFGEYTLQFLRAWIKPALWFFAFVANFHVTAHYGEAWISKYGFLGHACMAAGICHALFIALMFWRAVDDRPY